MDKEKSSLLWKRVKKIFMNVASVLAFFALIWSVIKLVGSDIPSLARGYEEIPIEYIEEEDWMGIEQTEVSKTVKKEITFEDGISKVVDRLLLLILSGAVLIAEPVYRKYSEDN